MDRLSWIEKLGVRVLGLHSQIYQRTNGWIGHTVPGLPPNLLLHTVGAKTGKARTSTLSYARDGDDYLIVASMGGAPRSPAWYHNLKSNPEVEINVGPKRLRATARPVLPDNPEYARLWRIVNANNADRYNGYQRRTTRPIPVVALTPASSR